MAANYVPERGDLVWLQFDPKAGSEQAGRRPALVISPKSYNRKVGLALVCPVTSQVKKYPFEVPLPDEAGIGGVVLCDQIKSLDWRARRATRISRATPNVVQEATARLLALIDPD
ncbi:MAG: endoribonuclease MazF [Candidatus Eisenbacteria bacterium]|nr:endoribonuclease MazF [Candidatus Eisenbacteria bacterium]